MMFRIQGPSPSPGLFLLGSALLGACSHGDPGDQAQVLTRPNIVLVISDDQDFEHLGFMGSELARTPTLDKLAEEGLTFETAYVPSSRCRPSLAALLSGRWPHQNGVVSNQGGKQLDPAGSLPLLLKNAGYATYMGGKFWEGDLEDFGFSNQYQSDKYSFVRQGQAGLFDFIDRFGGRDPLFIWWAPMLPHLPHDPPQAYLDLFELDMLKVPDQVPARRADEFRESEQLSLAMEAWFDAGLGELRAKLASKDLLESSLFVFLIDNGYANGAASKGTAYEKGLRTPIVISQPGVIPRAQRSRALVSSLDLYPTILDYAGVQPADAIAGRSLRGLIDGDASQARQVLCGLQYAKAIEAGEEPLDTAIALYARDARWKYILYLQDMPRERQRNESAFSAIKIREWTRGQEEFFDLEADPEELTSLHAASEQRQHLLRLRAEAVDWLQASGAGDLELP